MEASSLLHLEPPGKGRSPAAVADEIVHLIRSEYRYNTATLCRFFLCDRQWVDKTFRGAVRHIRITHYFAQYILTHASLSERDRALLAGGFYFYSESSLRDYWNTHAAAERKTRLIDLADYRRGRYVSDLVGELDFHRAQKPCAKEKQRHLRRMEALLTEEGYRLYLLSLGKPREWVACPLPVLERTLRFTNLAAVRQTEGLHSNSTAMGWLIRHGAVRIKLGSRALWLVPDASSLRVPLAIPANVNV